MNNIPESERELCDLCRQRPILRGGITLCADCAEGVARVIQVDAWMRNRAEDIDRNNKQVDEFRKWIKERKKALEESQREIDLDRLRKFM